MARGTVERVRPYPEAQALPSAELLAKEVVSRFGYSFDGISGDSLCVQLLSPAFSPAPRTTRIARSRSLRVAQRPILFCARAALFQIYIKLKRSLHAWTSHPTAVPSLHLVRELTCHAPDDSITHLTVVLLCRKPCPHGVLVLVPLLLCTLRGPGLRPPLKIKSKK